MSAGRSPRLAEGRERAALDFQARRLALVAAGQVPAAYAEGMLRADLVGKSGAAYRTRTCDPLITNEVLYQLS